MTDLISAQPDERRAQGSQPACAVCDHTPAADVSYHRHVGLIVYVRFSRIQGPFCRDCGQARFRDATAETISSGLWSPVSVVLAPLAVIRNLRARRAVRALDAPAPRPGVPTNLAPLPPTRPVFARPKSWLAPLLLVALIVGAVLADDPSRQKLDAVGGCVDFGTFAHVDTADFVTCDKPHEAVITSIERSWEACRDADGYIEQLYRYYCLDALPGTGPLPTVP